MSFNFINSQNHLPRSLSFMWGEGEGDILWPLIAVAPLLLHWTGSLNISLVLLFLTLSTATLISPKNPFRFLDFRRVKFFGATFFFFLSHYGTLTFNCRFVAFFRRKTEF